MGYSKSPRSGSGCPADAPLRSSCGSQPVDMQTVSLSVFEPSSPTCSAFCCSISSTSLTIRSFSSIANWSDSASTEVWRVDFHLSFSSVLLDSLLQLFTTRLQHLLHQLLACRPLFFPHLWTMMSEESTSTTRIQEPPRVCARPSLALPF